MAPHRFIGRIPESKVTAARKGLLELTPGEVRIFREMLTASPLPDVAARLGLSLRTVNTVGARITAKTGCSRGELVRICCFDLVDDGELFERLEAMSSLYPTRTKSAAGRFTRIVVEAEPG